MEKPTEEDAWQFTTFLVDPLYKMDAIPVGDR